MKLSEEISAELDKLAMTFTINFISSAYDDNPLDTGLSRSNWNATNKTSLTTRFSISTKGLVVESAREFCKSTDLTKTFWITNNVEYAGYLADGSSPQARAGWVDRLLHNSLRVAYGGIA